MEAANKKPGFFSQLMDRESLLHKIATYGVAIVLLGVCLYISRTAEELSPSLGTLLLGFLLYYAFLSRRILETLIFGALMGVTLLYGGGSWIEGVQEMFYVTMEMEDFVWIILNCALLNIMVKLMGRARSMDSFGGMVRRHAKSGKTLNLWTWLMQFPMFFDDYMHITVLGGVMTPIYDKEGVPREEEAFIIQTLGEPIRALFPFTGWTAFMAGIFVVEGFADSYGDGLMAFVKTIPFSFYSWVAIIGSLLFALGLFPKLGGIKNPDPSVYRELEVPAEEEDDGPKAKRKGNLFDFFMPIAAMIVLSYFFEWDLVPALLILLPCVIIYYMLRGIITVGDIEGSIVEGTAEFVYLDILILFSYMLGLVLEEIGYTEYLVEIAQQFADPRLLPFMLFVIFCISEAAMSLNWNLLLIAFPVILPLAVQIGANPYMCAAAMISAGAFGNNFCYVCDFTSLTASTTGLPSAYQARNCLPYSLIFAGISAVLYLVCGLIF